VNATPVSSNSPPGKWDWEEAVRSDQAVTGNLLLVLLTFSTYTSEKVPQAFPGEARLAEATGLSRVTVRRHLATAREEGWLLQVKRGHRTGDGRGLASVYERALPQPLTADRLTPLSTDHGRAVEARSTDQTGRLNRSNGASQPITGDRPIPYRQSPRDNFRAGARQVAPTHPNAADALTVPDADPDNPAEYIAALRAARRKGA